MRKKILILGGYGTLGFLVAKYLANHGGDLELILGGRNLAKATSAADRIKNETGFLAVSGITVDAADPISLEQAFAPVDIVVVASSTLKYVEAVANAAIKTDTDYLDTQLSSPFKLDILEQLENRIIESGRIFITDGGFHPGLLAAIVRWANLRVGPLSEANIYGALKIDWSKLLVSRDTIEEMVEEFRFFDMSVLRDGKWTKAKYSDSVKFDFGAPYNMQDCVPMLIEEVKKLPSEISELQNAGFYVSGFNKFLDYFLFPLMMLFLSIGMKFMAARLFTFGLSFSKPPFGTRLVAICKGKNEQIWIKFDDETGYVLTAVPTVACILQYLDGTITDPGLYWQALVVEPERFFKDMKELGLRMEVS